MQRALELAERNAVGVSPNPAVGAVIVRYGVVVGEGYTQPPGGAHAEVMALQQAGGKARGATMYVSLEPCCHYGRTPPCTRAIISAGIADVHFPIIDPDAQMNGRGKDELQAAGVGVHIGKGEEQARSLNEAYLKHRTTGLPFVIGKFACSLDGRIAARSGEAKWISGPESQEWIHQLRTRVDAIMVGSNTLLADDPLLTARPGGNEQGAHQPIRIVLDSQGRTPTTARVLAGPSRTIIATTDRTSSDWREAIEGTGTEVLAMPGKDSRVDLQILFRQLAERGVMSILVDGGGVLLGSIFDEHLVDKVIAIISPLIIGASDAPAAVAGRGAWRLADALCLTSVTIEKFGKDIMVIGYTDESYSRSILKQT